ncbi:MAG: ParB/Srx family N-terminal domain-containing protein [Desulfovibrionaceae bacterium]|nr:ParB/Srx family N-terminal domain-containing protein [Desulfovibrionaceae bacterium]
MDFLKVGTQLVPRQLAPSNLYLDPNNPRLKGEKDYQVSPDADPTSAKTQEQILNYLVKNKRYDIDDLVNSIAKVGFLRMDRIVVTEVKKDCYVVLEGNRRVAAIKYLMKEIEEQKRTIQKEISKSFESIDVLVLDGKGLNKVDIQKITWFLQGVRHISGIKRWGPYQQAELIKQFTDSGLNFTEAGEAVGLSRVKAGRMLRAYTALNLMRENDQFAEHATPDKFSHFEQIFAQPAIRHWLGWNEDAGAFNNTAELIRFYEIITEEVSGKDTATAQDVRDKLPKVLDSTGATEALMKGASVAESYVIANAQSAAAAPTWVLSVKETIKKVKLIPWSHELSDEEVTLFKELEKLITKLLASKSE